MHHLGYQLSRLIELLTHGSVDERDPNLVGGPDELVDSEPH